jgi:hypothetical protein
MDAKLRRNGDLRLGTRDGRVEPILQSILAPINR